MLSFLMAVALGGAANSDGRDSNIIHSNGIDRFLDDVPAIYVVAKFADQERPQGIAPSCIAAYPVTSHSQKNQVAIATDVGHTIPTHVFNCAIDLRWQFQHLPWYKLNGSGIGFSQELVKILFYSPYKALRLNEHSCFYRHFLCDHLPRVLEFSFAGAKKKPPFINFKLQQLRRDIYPRPLGVQGDVVGFDHRCGGIVCAFYRYQSGVQRPFNVPNPYAGNNRRDRANYGHDQRPKSHPLLGAQILLGACCFVAGLYSVINAFERGSSISPDAGALRVGLGALGMIVGGCIAAFSFAPL